MTSPDIRDTIPRLHRVVDHARDQLIGLANGQDTFEQCRLRYLETQRRLVREGRGRITASRVSDDERNWAPTRDCLQELMRWGAVESARVPSERKFVDRYRDHRYDITDRGREMAAAARQSRAAFTDAVTASVIEAHPYFRRLLEVLDEGVIAYPVVWEGDIARGRRDQRGVQDWALWGTERIAGDASTAATLHELSRGLQRFKNREDKPTNKELAEAMSDGFAVAGFAARGLAVDSTTIKALLRWGSELLVYDRSRYVPTYPQTTVLWGCSDLGTDADGRLIATRRGLSAYSHQVAMAIVDAYREQADVDESKMEAPFIAVHRVRAQVAAEIGVTRALVDRVLVDLVDGEFADVPASAAVYVGSTTQLPDSELPFRYRGGRRLVMQVTPKS